LHVQYGEIYLVRDVSKLRIPLVTEGRSLHTVR